MHKTHLGCLMWTFGIVLLLITIAVVIIATIYIAEWFSIKHMVAYLVAVKVIGAIWKSLAKVNEIVQNQLEDK